MDIFYLVKVNEDYCDVNKEDLYSSLLTEILVWVKPIL